MIMKKILLLSALCSISFLACKKKSEDVPAPAPLEDFTLDRFIERASFNDQTGIVFSNTQLYECGYVFETKIAGTITDFSVKFPSPSSNVKILVWDASTLTPIASQNFGYYFVGEYETKTITTPIALQANKKYCVSINTFTNGYYTHSRNGFADAKLPMEFKNLRLLSLNTAPTTSANLRIFPSQVQNNTYYGDVSFTFQ
jgi:Domain of unknown function (DUF4082)